MFWLGVTLTAWSATVSEQSLTYSAPVRVGVIVVALAGPCIVVAALFGRTLLGIGIGIGVTVLMLALIWAFVV